MLRRHVIFVLYGCVYRVAYINVLFSGHVSKIYGIALEKKGLVPSSMTSTGEAFLTSGVIYGFRGPDGSIDGVRLNPVTCKDVLSIGGLIFRGIVRSTLNTHNGRNVDGNLNHRQVCFTKIDIKGCCLKGGEDNLRTYYSRRVIRC